MTLHGYSSCTWCVTLHFQHLEETKSDSHEAYKVLKKFLSELHVVHEIYSADIG